MKGTLRGDLSRLLFDPPRHYSAVRMQQGRVLLDSDWNAQVDLAADRLRTGTRDVIGPHGAPAGDSGFEILPRALLAFDSPGHRLTLAGAGLGDLGTGFTVEAWVAPRTAGRPGVLLSRLSRPRPDLPFEADLVLSVTEDGRLLFRHHRHQGGPPGPDTAPGALTSEAKVSFRGLHHVALVLGPREAALYLDGEPTARAPWAPPPAAPEAIFVVGAVGPAGAGAQSQAAFTGLLQGLRLWRGARTEEEIRRRHPHVPSEAATDLIGFWRFEGLGTETEVADLAGGGPAWRLGGGPLHEERPEHYPRWVLRRVDVGAGRFYVDGLLCRNERTVPFDGQPDHPAAVLPDLRPGEAHLFYLDAWEETVTAWQDPRLLEPALGGADTTLRSRVVSQVRTLPLPTEGERPSPESWIETWDTFVRRARRQGRLRARRVPSANALDNRLYRVEIHSAGGAWGWPRPEGADVAEIEILEAGDGGSLVRPSGGLGQEWSALGPGTPVEVFSPETDSQSRPGVAAAVVTAETDPESGRRLRLNADLSPLAAHLRLFLRPLASFKWSRRNASVAYPVVHLAPGSQVVGLGAAGQSCLDLEAGDVVELFDRESVLEGRTERLYRVLAVDEANLEVTLDGAPDPRIATRGANGDTDDPARAPMLPMLPTLRRWDQKPRNQRSLVGGAVPMTVGAWLPLEDGVEVLFEGDDPYRPGDFWQIPTRTATDDLLWPWRDAGLEAAPSAREPASLPPHGVEHHYAPLAVLSLGADGVRLRDCRRTFQPLTTGAVSKAGDTMDGPLVIRSDLTVEGEVRAGGLLGPLGSPGAVASFNVQDGAVTAPKLAAGLGIVPPGYMILGERPEVPPGYASTGLFVTLTDQEAPWRARTPMPRSEPGPLQAAVVRGKVYLLFESGRLWEYDPADDRWCARRPSPQPLVGSAVAAAQGQVVVIGGEDGRGHKRGTVLAYHPAADQWSAGTEMLTPRSHLALTELDGHLHALGGLRRGLLGEWATRRHERYDPVTERWTRRAPLPRGRYALGAGSVAGRVYAVGGARRFFCGLWGHTLTNDHTEYEPAADKWLPAAPLPTPRLHPGVATVAGRLWAVGGESLFGWLADSEEYDPELDRWRRRPPAPEPLAGPGLGAVGGHLLAIGCMGQGARSVVCAWESPVAMRLFVHRKLGPGEGPPGEAERTESGAAGPGPSSGRELPDIEAELAALERDALELELPELPDLGEEGTSG